MLAYQIILGLYSKCRLLGALRDGENLITITD
jgi:hypothetical protein